MIVELKSVEKILSVHEAQLLTYLKLSGKRVGLLINFNVPLLKDGIHRRILGEDHVNNGELKNADYTEKTEPQSTLRNNLLISQCTLWLCLRSSSPTWVTL